MKLYIYEPFFKNISSSVGTNGVSAVCHRQGRKVLRYGLKRCCFWAFHVICWQGQKFKIMAALSMTRSMSRMYPASHRVHAGIGSSSLLLWIG